MELVYASGKDLENGWILSPKFLNSIQHTMEVRFKEDELPSLEQIEGTLIALRMHFTDEGLVSNLVSDINLSVGQRVTTVDDIHGVVSSVQNGIIGIVQHDGTTVYRYKVQIASFYGIPD